MKAKMFYKERTPTALNAILLGSSYFKENWKLIPRIVSVLNQILQWSHVGNEAPSITFQFFRDRLGNDYASIMAEIESLDLLAIDRAYRRKFTYGRNDNGKCYTYTLTDACCSALADRTRNIYRLLTDQKSKRLNQKRISARGYHKQSYGDVRDELKRTIDGIAFDVSKVETIADAYTPAKRAFVYSLLIDVVKKD